MKLKISQVVLILFIPYIGICQTQWGDQGIRQKFDEVYASVYQNDNAFPWDAYNMYYGSESVSLLSQNNLGSYGVSSLDALLVMYEATCDLDYIIEFMTKTTAIMNGRADKVSPQFSAHPYWFKDKVMWHGRLLMPLTKFVYMVENDNNLGSQIISNPSSFGGHTTYQNFSNWVNESNMDVMDYMIRRYWNSSTSCFCKPSESAPGPTILQNCNNSVAELNFQVPFGCALIYLHLVNGTPSMINYGLKAVNMAQSHLIYSNGIYTYDSANAAYKWKHQGWNPNMNYSEDIAHGGMDLLFPLLYNKFNSSFSNITGGMYFEWYQMVRLRNAFSRNIYNWQEHANIEAAHNVDQAFNSNVDGTNTGQWAPNQNSQGNLQLNAISFINLYKFDGISGSLGYDVYDILMKYYEYEVAGMAPSNFGGLKIKSLADMCAANYDMEGMTVECNYLARGRGADFKKNNSNMEQSIIFPNPSSGLISVSGSEISNIEIYSINGELLQSTSNQNNIDVSALAKGSYLILVLNNENVHVEKLIIE